jgi:hypothetical protein
VRPFVFTGGMLVPWRSLAARGLYDHTPDAGGVVALCGLGCALPLDYVDGCRGVVSLRVACRPHPRCRWCCGVVWSRRLRASVRLRRRHGALVWIWSIGAVDYTGGVLCSDLCLPLSCHAPPCLSLGWVCLEIFKKKTKYISYFVYY